VDQNKHLCVIGTKKRTNSELVTVKNDICHSYCKYIHL